MRSAPTCACALGKIAKLSARQAHRRFAFNKVMQIPLNYFSIELDWIHSISIEF
jgi:hypothetical protein